MLILSWNVAGLSTTVNRIHDNYSNTKPQTTTKTKKGSAQRHPAAALASYLERHGADLVCLQEHKISKSVLTNRSEPRQASTVPGYESFWSCCLDDAAKGLNGVVTYAKAGTVQSADGTAPLGVSRPGSAGTLRPDGSRSLLRVQRVRALHQWTL